MGPWHRDVLHVRGQDVFGDGEDRRAVRGRVRQSFNILNKANPNMNVASGSFGLISQSQGVEQGGPRSIQMQLRVLF
jgi:hypothetical protein